MTNKSEKQYGNVTVIQRSDYSWGVINDKGNEIVPFGKYGWIDGFDEHGLARVRTAKLKDDVVKAAGQGIDLCEDDIWAMHYFTGDKVDAEKLKHPMWGIIDMEGNEVLPVEYDSIWNFFGKDRDTTKVEKDGQEYEFSLEDRNLISYDDEDNYYCYSGEEHYSSRELEEYTWDALTDGQYGDMPDDFDGDYSFLDY
jgi:hypothetical protein